MGDPVNDFQRLLTLLGRADENVRIARGNANQFATATIGFDAIPGALDMAKDWNLWFELNPSMYDATQGRSSAQHITRLSALYADLDFKVKPHGVGSLPEAMDVVRDLERALGTPAAAIVHTGHGIQPYWPLDAAYVNDLTRNNVASLLKRWGVFVQEVAKGNHGGADSVFDLPRILRVPGTINVKDADNPVPTSVDFLDHGERVDLVQLAEMLDDYQVPSEAQTTDGGEKSPSADWAWAEKSCHFLQVASREIAESSPAARHPWALKWAALTFGMVRSGCLTEDDFYTLQTSLKDRFDWLLANEGTPRTGGQYEFAQILKFGRVTAEGWSKAKLGMEMRQHLHDTLNDVLSLVPAPPTSAPLGRDAIVTQMSEHQTFGALAVQRAPDPTIATGTWFTDSANAAALTVIFQGRFIYVPLIGWHIWEGNRYIPDVKGQRTQQAREHFAGLHRDTSDPAVKKWAHASQSVGRIRAALELTESFSQMVVTADQLDSSSEILNTPDGIVNLRNGVLREANPAEDFHTLQTSCTPKPMPIPRFLEFITWALEDAERIAYMQRLFGLAAVGKLRVHVFPILLGTGGNGKSVLLEIVTRVLGTYATTMPAKFLMTKFTDSHPTEIAQLKGVRLAVINEVPPGAKFDEALMKTLTGDGRLKARYMRADFIEFENTATIMLAANHLPEVTVGGDSFWRRARQISFNNTVAAGDVNLDLVDQIVAAEGPGILQWIIDGAVDMFVHGERPPAIVILDTDEYRRDQDAPGRYMEDNLITGTGFSVRKIMVYDDYSNWMRRQGLEPLDATKFYPIVKKKFKGSDKGDSQHFVGINLKPRGWGVE